jgi:hypothetical protein
MEATVTDVASIEAALRNPARSAVIEAHNIGPKYTRHPYAVVELHQLIPISEHNHPWVLVTVEAGEREVEAYNSFRWAETDLAEAVNELQARYLDQFGEDSDDWDDED